MDIRARLRFRLRTLLLAVTAASVVFWFFVARPLDRLRRQTSAGRKSIHQRDRTYFDFVFDDRVKANLVTVIGDSRLTH